jgi:hypothetical protein
VRRPERSCITSGVIRADSRFTYTFPSTPVSIGIGLSGAIATTTNSVMITVPTFREGTLAGSGGGFSVSGAYDDTHLQTSELLHASASVEIAAGTQTCPF